MSRKSKKRKRKKRAKKEVPDPKQGGAPNRTDPRALESPNSVAATVAWLLATLATVLGLLAALGAQLLYLRNREPDTQTFVHLFLFAASITGLVALTLTMVVKRVRRIPAPRNVTIAAIVIGLAPFVIQVAQRLVGK